MSTCLGCFNPSADPELSPEERKLSFEMVMNDSDRKWVFIALTSEELNTWLHAIRSLLPHPKMLITAHEGKMATLQVNKEANEYKWDDRWFCLTKRKTLVSFASEDACKFFKLLVVQDSKLAMKLYALSHWPLVDSQITKSDAALHGKENVMELTLKGQQVIHIAADTPEERDIWLAVIKEEIGGAAARESVRELKAEDLTEKAVQLSRVLTVLDNKIGKMLPVSESMRSENFGVTQFVTWNIEYATGKVVLELSANRLTGLRRATLNGQEMFKATKSSAHQSVHEFVNDGKNYSITINPLAQHPFELQIDGQKVVEDKKDEKKEPEKKDDKKDEKNEEPEKKKDDK